MCRYYTRRWRTQTNQRVSANQLNFYPFGNDIGETSNKRCPVEFNWNTMHVSFLLCVLWVELAQTAGVSDTEYTEGFPTIGYWWSTQEQDRFFHIWIWLMRLLAVHCHFALWIDLANRTLDSLASIRTMFFFFCFQMNSIHWSCVLLHILAPGHVHPRLGL